MEGSRSVLLNNNIFLSIPYAQPQELVTCKFGDLSFTLVSVGVRV